MIARCLPPDEWRRIPDGTELAALVPMLRPGLDEILVIEDDDGQIVFCWSLILALHAEGVWLDESYRGRPKAKLEMLAQVMALMKTRVRSRGLHRVFTSAETDEIRSLIERVGGAAFPDSYTIGVD